MLYVDISRQNTQAARQAGRQTDIWGFPKIEDARKSSIYRWIFHCKPSIWGYPLDYGNLQMDISMKYNQDTAHEAECSHVEHFCETSCLNNLVHASRVTVPANCRLQNAEECEV